ncbi:MAG: DUF2341 domain-containing protein [Candidatus Bathyarchaeia archaeon]
MGWLSGWRYRKSIAVNSASGAGTNYQKLVKCYYGSGTDGSETVYGIEAKKIYLNSKAKSDFGDVRFTASDGETLLDYWLWDKSDGSWALFWVEIGADISSSGTTIYIYYHKPDATSASNPDATFDLYDDFDDGNFNTTKWSKTELSPGYVTESGGYLNVYGSGSWDKNGAWSNSTFNRSSRGLSIMFRAKVSEKWAGVIFGYGAGLNYADGIYFYPHDVNIYRMREGSAQDLYTSYSANTEYFFEVRIKQSAGYRLIFEGTEKENDTSFSDNNHRVVIQNCTSAIIGHLNYVFVRKYVDPEPTWGSSGSEEDGAIAGAGDLSGEIGIRGYGLADIAAQIGVRGEGVPKDLSSLLFVGKKNAVIFGSYEFPGVQTIERLNPDLFIEKPIPGRSKAYRAVIGAMGQVCRIRGSVKAEDPKALVAQMRALADGTVRWFYDGQTHAFPAIMRRPRFHFSADRPGWIEYEVEFAEKNS